MRKTHPHVAKFREQFSRLTFAKRIGHRAFRLVRAMVEKISRAQITPAISQKLLIMDFPDLLVLVSPHASKRLCRRLLPVLLPAPGAREDFEQRSNPHVRHDPKKIVETALMVEHHDCSAVRP